MKRFLIIQIPKKAFIVFALLLLTSIIIYFVFINASHSKIIQISKILGNEENNESITGNIIFKAYTDITLTGEAKKLPGVSIVIIGNDGQVLDEIVTNEEGEAKIKLTVPLNKKYSYTTQSDVYLDKELMNRGTVTAIAYKAGYLPVVIFEVLVRDSTYVEPFYMPPEIPGDRKKATGILSNIHPIDSLNLAEKYYKTLIAEIPESNIKLFSKNEIRYGMYKDFVLEVNNKEKTFDWKNVTNPTYFPRLYLSDLTGDGEKELIVILTHDYGTGVLKEEVHIIALSDLTEITVDNPLDIIEKEVTTKIIEQGEKKLIEVNINDRPTTIKLEKTYTPVWFNDIGFGSIIDFDVNANKLKARIPAQISPAGFIGEIIIYYKFKDNRFQY